MNEKLKNRLDKIKGELSPQCSLTAKSLLIAIEGLEKLACLGNGDRWGNSLGNEEAQQRLNIIVDTWEGQ